MMNTAPDRQTEAKKNIAPWYPIKLATRGKHFTTTNAHTEKRETQKDTPNSLNRSGISSATTVIEMVATAHDEINRINEKLAIGIQLYASTS